MLKLFERRKPPPQRGLRPPPPQPEAPGSEAARALRDGRLVYLVRDRERLVHTPADEACLRQAMEALEASFALVPAGTVELSLTLDDSPQAPRRRVDVEPFLLETCAVTNRRYQAFVQAGAYEDLSLWPAHLWPHLVNLCDQTGHPGPRFWREGRYPPGRDEHPVVGICWYEADAYARWIGARLPSEAEWQMAASWCVPGAGGPTPRRYPWGDTLDHTRCNIWSSGIGDTLPVDAFPEGAAPNGVRGLIGNVWEWTADDFAIEDGSGRPVQAAMLLKSIRGGAYDTYFPTETSATFRAAQGALVRSPNIGFRCALSLADAPWLT